MLRINALSFTLAALIVTNMLVACTTTSPRAPVIERLPSAQTIPTPTPAKKIAIKPKESDWRPSTYTVQKGDTLYSIALEHGHDYKEIAEWNGISAPYGIRIGQVLRLGSAQTEATTPLKTQPIAEAKPLSSSEPGLKTEPKALKQPYSDKALALLEKSSSKPALPEPPKPENVPKPELAKADSPKPVRVPEPVKPDTPNGDEDAVDWGWPASGKILTNFNDNGNSKGVDISGILGQPVNAAASGKVVHTGNTLRGYGKLIIVKHNKSYFSVYAHNNLVLVQEGQSVVKGQKIAEMGSSDADRVKLHFEIRHLGKPADPLKFLPN